MKRIAFILLSLVVVGCGLNTPGESDKIGQIVSVHKQGMVCTTWEASIIRGGFSQGSGVNGAAFNFTIESDSLARVVQQYMKAGTEVEIHYRTEGIYKACRSDSGGDFLVSIAPVKV